MNKSGIASKIIIFSCAVVFLLMIVGSILIIQYEIRLLDNMTEDKIDQKENAFQLNYYNEKKELEIQLKKQLQNMILIMKSVDVIYEQTYLFQIQMMFMQPMIIAVEFCDLQENPFLSAWLEKNIIISNQLPKSLDLNNLQHIKIKTDIPAISLIHLYYTTDLIKNKLLKTKNQDIEELYQIRKDIYSELRGVLLTQSIGTLLIVAILCSFLIFSLRLFILNPIEELMETSSHLKKLDLSIDIRSNTHSYEFNHLFQAIGQLLGGFRKIISDVQENAGLLSDSADNMTDIAEQLTNHSVDAESQTNSVAEASVQISGNINSIAGSVEQISENVQSVSMTSEYLFQNINSVANAIEELSSSLTHVGERVQIGTQIAEKAVLLAQKAGETMNTLRHAANEIGGVSEFIQRIAHKTNILSLNATIEAASAGSAGRGFSVVASAIQEFAEQSSRAAKDITERIAGVQKGTLEIETAFLDVSAIIKEMNLSSESISFSVIEQTKAVQEIANNALEADERARNINIAIEDLSKTANDAAENTTQVALGANDVSTRIHRVSKTISFNRQISHQINEAAIVLNHLSGNLKDMVDPFKVRNNETKS
ncbi:Methyl-accepting chemotaxis protein [Candidatus Magnetomorum sp. HK-1]|nr:Methyl-accepting chemotaxis protein [Candidatus Magnetomorum sp. HK-1]